MRCLKLEVNIDEICNFNFDELPLLAWAYKRQYYDSLL
jgi:hypothetical protein